MSYRDPGAQHRSGSPWKGRRLLVVSSSLRAVGLSTAPAGAGSQFSCGVFSPGGCPPACGSSYVLGWVVNENIYSLVNASVLILEVIERGSGVQKCLQPWL